MNNPDSRFQNSLRSRLQCESGRRPHLLVYAKSLCSFDGSDIPSLLGECGFQLVGDLPAGPVSSAVRVSVRCSRCQVVFERSLLYLTSEKTCPNCDHSVSRPEREICDFLTSIGLTVEQGNKTILGGRHIDLYIPGHRLGIELDGLLWHSELRNPDRAGSYHRCKTDDALAKGIRLVHFWDCEWDRKRDIVKSMLRSMLGLTGRRIYARKCRVSEIPRDEAASFYGLNHLQGGVTATVHLGLYHREELVSAMSFTRSPSGSWSLVRFASVLESVVVGGFSKLFSRFVNDYSPGEVVSFGDLRWVDRGSNVYLRNGFRMDKLIPPAYHYVVDGYKGLSHRFNFRRAALARMFGENFDHGKTEWENMRDNGFDRVWDCGLVRFVWTSQ